MPSIRSEIEDIHVSLTDKGEQVFYDGEGRPSVSPILVQAFRLTGQYRDELAEAHAQLNKRVDARLEQDKQLYEVLTTLHLKAPELLTRADFEAALADLELTFEEPIPYKEPQPTEYQVHLLLAAEAKEKLGGISFGRLTKRQEEYIGWHFEERMAREQQEWEQRKANYEMEEALTVERENQARIKAYEQDKARLKGAIAGERTSIEEAVSEWTKTVEVPYAFGAGITFEPETGTANLRVSLPVREDLPQTHVIRLKNGGMSEEPLTSNELNKLLSDVSLSLCAYLVVNVFNASPSISEVLLEAYMLQPKRAGIDKDTFVIGGVINRANIDTSQVRSRSSQAYATRIGLEYSLGKNGQLRPITSPRKGGKSASTSKVIFPTIKVPKIALPEIDLPKAKSAKIDIPIPDIQKLDIPNFIPHHKEHNDAYGEGDS